MQKDKLVVAAYARVSTDKDDQANSLVSQREYFAEYIRRHPGWILKEVYYDEGLSGTQTMKRIGFNRMIDAARHGEIDLILTKEVSRFARNTVDTLTYTRELKAMGVYVIFMNDNIDTSDHEGEFRLTMMSSIAQEESRKTSERVKWGQQRRMEQGVVFGRDMLGYDVRGGKMYINEEDVPTVKAIFRKYTLEGKGTHVIARELVEEGLWPKRISHWSPTVILRVLRNEKYVGDLCQKKTFTPDYLTHAKKYNRGQEEKVYLSDHHEPIISRELWDKTQEEMKHRQQPEQLRGKHGRRYWCSGKLYCAECGNGRSFVSRTRSIQHGTYRAWRCYEHANHGSRKVDANGKVSGCDNNSVNDRVLRFCMGYSIRMIQVKGEHLQKEILSEISRIIQSPESDQLESKERIQREIDGIQSKKRELIDLMLNGIISAEDLKSQNDWYDEKIAVLQNREAQAQEAEALRLRQARGMQVYIDTIREIMKYDETNEALYGEILDHMDIHKGNVLDIWLKDFPFGIRLKVKHSGKLDDYKIDVVEESFIDTTPCSEMV